MATIHPSAVVHPGAKLAHDVEVGPFCMIGPNVTVGAGTRFGPHVVVEGYTSIGERNVFHGSSHIGCAPQDMKYANEPTRLTLGDDNAVFQYVTISTGTIQDQGLTAVGNKNWIMAYCHIAHDCVVENNTIFASHASLAGHVHIGDWVFLGGFSTVHQFCRIGEHAMTAFTAAVTQDVPPYVTAAGNRAAPAGINSEGMRRRGFTSEQIAEVKRAYKVLYRQGLPFEEASAQIAARAADCPELKAFVDFFALSKRGLIR